MTINSPSDPEQHAAAADPGTVAELLAAGRHVDAAALALRDGDAGRAAKIYEQIWDFGSAARAAHAGGDLPNALRYALDARDAPFTRELLGRLTSTDEGSRAAVDILARARQYDQAAALAERVGDRERAIDLYQRAHLDLDAARLLEAAGRDREAGRLLERAVDLLAGDERAQAHLQLGRVLAHRAAYADAARHLQEAARSKPTPPPAIVREALQHLVATLAAMGLRDGARDILLELRRDDETIEADLDLHLRAWRQLRATTPAQTDRDVVADRYRLGPLLGAGSAGRVYLADDEVTGRQVAVKLVHAADARGGTAFERFVREARVASGLRHASLVEVHDVSIEHGLIVMEYLSGGSLAQRVASGEVLTPSAVRRLMLEVVAGLEAAHHRGVVHRDVKPANIFFDARGAAKLGDFGVAHLIDLGQTQTGGLIGTLAYMSPEQITGAPITVAADFYALGITTFEALTGRLPFLGPDFVAQHLGEEAPAPTSIVPTLAPGWDPLLAALLRKDPQGRMASAEQLRRALDELVLAAPRVSLRPLDPEPPVAAVVVNNEPAARTARYQHHTPLGATDVSSLERAVDTALDRSVVRESFVESELGAEAMNHARRLGAVASPFVQRALAWNRSERTLVFEAPSGSAWRDAVLPTQPTEWVRLLKRLARGAASMHEFGLAHGHISATMVVVDEGHVPTIMLAGNGAVTTATPADDVNAIVALLAEQLRCAPSWPALAAALGGLGVDASPVDGEQLYAAVDALEIAIIKARLAS